MFRASSGYFQEDFQNPITKNFSVVLILLWLVISQLGRPIGEKHSIVKYKRGKASL
jgi:hypothetical protein